MMPFDCAHTFARMLVTRTGVVGRSVAGHYQGYAFVVSPTGLSRAFGTGEYTAPPWWSECSQRVCSANVHLCPLLLCGSVDMPQAGQAPLCLLPALILQSATNGLHRLDSMLMMNTALGAAMLYAIPAPDTLLINEEPSMFGLRCTLPALFCPFSFISCNGGKLYVSV